MIPALAALLIASVSVPASAQTSSPDKIQALRIESPIKLDGILDEEAWAKASHISNFTQRELVENAPATERTEVAVAYSGQDLYIGVWCFDSQPDQIVAQKMKWDFDTGTDDNFEIVIDTYGDRRNAYFFAVNPKLYGSVFGQWNNDDDEILFNFRVTWIPKPGAVFYFVFNEFGDTLDPRAWRMNKTVAMVKFVWYFDTK